MAADAKRRKKIAVIILTIFSIFVIGVIGFLVIAALAAKGVDDAIIKNAIESQPQSYLVPALHRLVEAGRFFI